MRGEGPCSPLALAAPSQAALEDLRCLAPVALQPGVASMPPLTWELKGAVAEWPETYCDFGDQLFLAVSAWP